MLIYLEHSEFTTYIIHHIVRKLHGLNKINHEIKVKFKNK